MRSPIAWLPLASGFLVLVLSLAVAVITVSSKNSANLATNQGLTTKAAEQNASLSLSPAEGDFTLNSTSTYPVGIVVDSAGKAIDGTDVIINFDPTKVQVVSSAVSPTTIFQEFPINTIDNTRGQIRFSALTFNARPATGIIGTFQFKPVVKGEVNFSFAFTPGATTDSNIAEHGTAKDVLGKVTNGRFNFK